MHRYFHDMATIYSQTQVGTCDFLDVLEEAAVAKQPVAVVLSSGETFNDQVQDVVTENHENWAVFGSRGRVKVSDIKSCSRAEPKPGLILGDVHA